MIVVSKKHGGRGSLAENSNHERTNEMDKNLLDTQEIRDRLEHLSTLDQLEIILYMRWLLFRTRARRVCFQLMTSFIR